MDRLTLGAGPFPPINDKDKTPLDPFAQTAKASNRKAALDEGKTAELKKSAQAFESYFVQSLLKEMRKTIKKAEKGQSEYGGDLYQSLFDEAIATKLTENGGIGLAEVLIRNLSKKD